MGKMSAREVDQYFSNFSDEPFLPRLVGILSFRRKTYEKYSNLYARLLSAVKEEVLCGNMTPEKGKEALLESRRMW